MIALVTVIIHKYLLIFDSFFSLKYKNKYSIMGEFSLWIVFYRLPCNVKEMENNFLSLCFPHRTVR